MLLSQIFESFSCDFSCLSGCHPLREDSSGHHALSRSVPLSGFPLLQCTYRCLRHLMCCLSVSIMRMWFPQLRTFYLLPYLQHPEPRLAHSRCSTSMDWMAFPSWRFNKEGFHMRLTLIISVTVTTVVTSVLLRLLCCLEFFGFGLAHLLYLLSLCLSLKAGVGL